MNAGAGEAGEATGGLRPGYTSPVGEGHQDSRTEAQVEPSFPETDSSGGAGQEDDKGPRLFGLVVRPGGAPVGAARVIMRKAQRWLAIPADLEDVSSLIRPGPVHEILTDDKGRFEFTNVVPGDLTLSIVARGFAPLMRGHLAVPIHENHDLGRFQLELGVQLGGKVTGPRGQGVEGVCVLRAVSPEGGFMRLDLPGRGIEVDLTDVAGNFEVTSLVPGSWHLIFDHPEYRIGELTGSTEPAGQTDPGLIVNLSQGLSIEGRVEGLDPVLTSLRVTARRSAEQANAATETLQGAEKYRPRQGVVLVDGSFTLGGLVPGLQYQLMLYRLNESSEDDPDGSGERWSLQAGVDAELALAGAKDVVLEHSNEASLAFSARAVGSGQVLESGRTVESGQAVEHFVVQVSGDRLRGGGFLKHAGQEQPRSAFPKGQALFEGLRPGEEGSLVTLNVRAEGYEDFVRENILLLAGASLDLGAIELKPAIRIAVRVVERHSKKPIAGAHIVLSRNADRDQLAGWLENEKRPWMDDKVRDGYTDARGYGRLTAFPNSLCWLSVSAADYLAGSELRSILPHGEPLEFVLERAGRVTVRVLDNRSQPVAGLVVEHTAMDEEDDEKFTGGWSFGGRDAGSKTDEEGLVEFRDLTLGSHSFEVIEPTSNFPGRNRASATVSMASGMVSKEEVFLKPGEHAQIDLRVAARGGYRATILVAGEPLVGALARVAPIEAEENGERWWYSGGGEDPHSCISDHLGNISFEKLKVGRYTLMISHPERRMSVLREVLVEPAPSGAVIEIGSASVEGRITDRAGRPVTGVRVIVRDGRDQGSSHSDYRVRIVEDADGDADWGYEEVSQATPRSNKNGEYHLRSVRPDCALSVSLSHKYVVGERRDLAPLTADEYKSGVDFVVDRAGVLTVQVRGMSRNQFSAAYVSLKLVIPGAEGKEPQSHSRSRRVRHWRSRTTLNSLPVGKWQLTVRANRSAEPYFEAEVEVLAEQQVTFEVPEP